MSENYFNPAHAEWKNPQNRVHSAEYTRHKPEWSANNGQRQEFSQLAHGGLSPEILENPHEVLKAQLLNFNKSLMEYMIKERDRRDKRRKGLKEPGLAREGSNLNKAFGVAIQAGFGAYGKEGAKMAFTSIKTALTMATGINQRRPDLFPDAIELEKILLSGAITEAAAPHILNTEFGIKTFTSTSKEDMHGIDWWATPETATEHAGLSEQHNLAWAIQVKASGSAEEPLFLPYSSIEEADDRLLDFNCSPQHKESYRDACRKVFAVKEQYDNVQPVLFVLPNYYQNPGYYDLETSLPKRKLVQDIDDQLFEISERFETAA